jgi:methylenetetrahydrofolate reductase (NADPH)
VSRLSAALAAGEFVVTGEVAPPHGTSGAAMLEAARALAGSCHALNVTDNQGANLHLSSLGASKMLLDDGIEPIFQQTCRDRNRLALQSDLLAASSLGLENVLFVTGDDPRSGDHSSAKGVFDLDSTQLIQIAAGLNEGHDMIGEALDGSTSLFVGAAMFPEAEPWDVQQRKIVKKAEAGASFFQTQAYFRPEKLARAVEEVHALGGRVLAGVLLLRSTRVIEFINERLAGLFIPADIAERIRTATSPEEAAVDLAVEQVAFARTVADGVHIMPLGLNDRVAEIVERSAAL